MSQSLAVIFALVMYTPNGTVLGCSTGWDNKEQCDWAAQESKSNGRADILYNCAPYPYRTLGNTTAGFQCGGVVGER